MTKDDYQKLNEYLNSCFINLEVNDQFLLNNIHNLGRLSGALIDVTDGYNLKEDIEVEKLTFEDVYLLAREIIEQISSSYLPIYDNLISSGELDFSYTKQYYDSHFIAINKHELININRNFTYEDVTTLVHEFMHKMNHKEVSSINRYLLTEFISIYFEKYGKRYLLKKGICKEALNFNERLYCTIKSATNFDCYSRILLAYEKTGHIDEDSYHFLNKYYCTVSKEEFETECQKFLKLCNQVKNDYKMDIMYERPYNEVELQDRLASNFSGSYRYIFGTILAYYALKHCNKEKIVYLSDHINDEDFTHMSLHDCLKTIGIDLDNIGVKEFMDIIKEELDNNLVKKK